MVVSRGGVSLRKQELSSWIAIVVYWLTTTTTTTTITTTYYNNPSPCSYPLSLPPFEEVVEVVGNGRRG